MKTLLAYLTFATLLALCYIEKINAEAAKSQARGSVVGHHVRGGVPAGAEQRATVAQLRE